MQVIELRERGIYSLPDQREFVISESGDGMGYRLYSLSAWRRYGMPEYRAQANGRILRRGLVNTWRLEDLKDTGRTADSLQSVGLSTA